MGPGLAILAARSCVAHVHVSERGRDVGQGNSTTSSSANHAIVPECTVAATRHAGIGEMEQVRRPLGVSSATLLFLASGAVSACLLPLRALFRLFFPCGLRGTTRPTHPKRLCRGSCAGFASLLDPSRTGVEVGRAHGPHRRSLPCAHFNWPITFVDQGFSSKRASSLFVVVFIRPTGIGRTSREREGGRGAGREAGKRENWKDSFGGL